MGSDGVEEDVGIFVEKSATAQGETPRRRRGAAPGAVLQLFGHGGGALAISGGQCHPDQVRPHRSGGGLEVADRSDEVPRRGEAAKARARSPRASSSSASTQVIHSKPISTGPATSLRLASSTAAWASARLASVKGDVGADGVGEHVTDLAARLLDEAEPGLGLGEGVVPLAGVSAATRRSPSGTGGGGTGCPSARRGIDRRGTPTSAWPNWSASASAVPCHSSGTTWLAQAASLRWGIADRPAAPARRPPREAFGEADDLPGSVSTEHSA